MRIGFVTSVASKRLGGIQNTSYYFAEYFPKEVEMELFCSSESETEGLDCDISKTNCRSNETVKFHFQLLKHIFGSNRKKAFSFTFAALYPCALECYLLKKMKGIPYGVMMHGNELMDGAAPKSLFQNIKNKARFAVRKRVLDNADVLFANSEYTKGVCRSKTSNKNIQVIHPPIKFEKKTIDSSKFNYNIFSLGRLEKRKGFQYGVRAMAELVKEYPNLTYTIAGSGPYESKLKKLIDENQLQDCVKLLGRISEEEKEECYKNCDFFLMPSFIVKEESSVEGFGIVFIEANMYGKYVIATRTGGIQDAVREGITGEFVECRDTGSIVRVIKKLYSTPNLYDPLECVKWSKRMDISHIVNQYIYYIRKCIG